MYKKAKQLAEKKEDYTAEKIYICSVCGHTVEGEPPEKCPVCGSPKNSYREFSV
jgi:rubrerythrin